tara:strand:+ start:1833 stop:2924 length:1092 start_codon:yes stop_codon:yes gene_type:complete
MIKKFFRYVGIYGINRTVIKSLGRLKSRFPIWPFFIFKLPNLHKKKIGIIGCGQFSYSSITYYLIKSNKAKIIWCCDLNIKAAESMAKSYGIKKYFNEIGLNYKTVDLVYIATNHSSHCQYAIESLHSGCDVYIEKPMVTDWKQLELIKKAKDETGKNIFIGYNRPFSPGLSQIKKLSVAFDKPFTLSCFITGHFLDEDHWYRDDKEGTRICGNVGHWLDLSIHILSWRYKMPNFIDISINYSNLQTSSDNIAITLTTSEGDLINITFSTRGEPFEGVGETINFQQENLIAKIDDHRKTKIWVEKKLYKYTHWPKNVGHKDAIFQPFDKVIKRDWEETLISTKLMLTIADMVKDNNKNFRFNL